MRSTYAAESSRHGRQAPRCRCVCLRRSPAGVGVGLLLLPLLLALPLAEPVAEAARSNTRLSIAGGAGAATLRLSLSADTLRYLPLRGERCIPRCPARLTLRGHVRITARCAGAKAAPAAASHAAGPRCRGFSVRASTVAIQIDARGRPTRVDARGSVRLSAGRRHGSARRLLMLPRARRLTLEGEAKLADPDLGLSLAGARIALDLQTGALDVADARARFGGGASAKTKAGAKRSGSSR